MEIKLKITPLLIEHGVKRVAVFGRVARGEDSNSSDVDVLVELNRPFGLVQFVALKRGLEPVLKKQVDVVEYGAIKPAFAKNILNDAKTIYEQ